MFSRLMILGFIGIATRVHAAQVDCTWNGGAGNWNNAAMWSCGVVPNNGAGGNTYNVFIDGGDADISVVALNTSVTIDNLSVQPGETLNINSGQQLRFAGGAGAGTITNAGTLRLNSSGPHTYLTPTSGVLTLTGGGILEMASHENNWIYRDAAGGALVNVDNTIRGAGNLGWGGAPTAITNQGTIIANIAAHRLRIETTSAGFTNTGALRADGGTLQISGSTISNAGGTVEGLNGSFVDLLNGTIAGGTLASANGGAIRAASGNNFLDGTANAVHNTGLVLSPNGQIIALRGTLHNTGVVNINSSGADTYMYVDGAATLTGGGTVEMSDASRNWIYRFGAGGSLTNTDNIIRGAGNLGWNGSPTPITNAGTVIATQPANALNVHTGGAGFTNTGVLRADGGTLALSSLVTNTGGLIEARNGSHVDLVNATIVGGTLASDGAGLVRVPTTSSLLDGSTNAVTNSGTLRIVNGGQLRVSGTLINTGTIQLNGTNADTYLYADSAPAVLTGGGVVELSDFPANWIFRSAAGNSFINEDNTIRGAGNMGWGGSPTPITNQGTLLANAVNPLQMSGFPLANEGLLEVASGSEARVVSGTLSNTGTIRLRPDGELRRTTGTLALEDAGTLEIQIAGTGAGQAGQVITNVALTRNGTLHAGAVNGYVPALGDRIPVFSAGSFTGAFDNITDNFPGTLSATVEYTATTGTLVVIRAADLNCDGFVNNFDIDPFVLVLTDRPAYEAAFPDCEALNADANRDGVINNFDIDPFVNCLVSGGCP